MMYDVAKEKGGRYYVCRIGNEKHPVSGSYRKNKKDALHIAADMNGMEYKDFLKERKSNNNTE